MLIDTSHRSVLEVYTRFRIGDGGFTELSLFHYSSFHALSQLATSAFGRFLIVGISLDVPD